MPFGFKGFYSSALELETFKAYCGLLQVLLQKIQKFHSLAFLVQEIKEIMTCSSHQAGQTRQTALQYKQIYKPFDALLDVVDWHCAVIFVFLFYKTHENLSAAGTSDNRKYF